MRVNSIRPVPGLFGAMVDCGMSVGGERLSYIRSREDRERAAKFGVESVRNGRVDVIRPVMSRADADVHEFLVRPPATGYEDMLYPFLQPGTQAWREYMDTRKMVEYEGPDGSLKISVTSNIADKMSKSQALNPDLKTYQLVQLFTDPDVQLKFGVSLEVLHTLRAMAVAQPDQAALRATELLGKCRPDLDCLVVAGNYTTSRRRARDAVQKFCSRFPTVSATLDALVIGKELMLSSDNWQVFGPLEESKSLVEIHKAVTACGPQSVVTAMGSEFTLLGMDIAMNGQSLCPEITPHIGSEDDPLTDGSSSLTASLLTPQGKIWLQQMDKAVAEVTQNGVVVASSVRVSAGKALMNAHVMETTGCLIDGRQIEADRSLTPDLWIVKDRVVQHPAWAMREPRLGERVFVCYRGSSGSLQYTSPMSLMAAGDHGMTMSKLLELQPGMSGGAILALDDLALLGVYEGVGQQMAMGLSFTPNMFASVHSVSESSVARPGDNDAVFRMRDKGLTPYVQSVYDAVRPMYCANAHVGMGFVKDGMCVTACDPDEGPLSEFRGGQPMVFSPLDFGLYSARSVVGNGVGLVRSPKYYEKVVIVGRDESGPYYSSVTRVVHIGVSAKNFSLEPVDPDETLPFFGGLVMSLTDAAVLGVYVRRSTSSGLGLAEFCVAYPAVVCSDSGERDAVESVMRTFPVVHPGRWPSGAMEEVLTHSSVGKYKSPTRVFNDGSAPLALLGVSFLKMRMAKARRENGLSVRGWEEDADRRLCAPVLSKVCTRIGLAESVLFGLDVLDMGSRLDGYAVTVGALAGAVWLNEHSGTADVFADALLSLIDDELKRDDAEVIK